MITVVIVQSLLGIVQIKKISIDGISKIIIYKDIDIHMAYFFLSAFSLQGLKALFIPFKMYAKQINDLSPFLRISKISVDFNLMPDIF